MFENRKFIVFAVEHYNTLGLIRSLGEKGLNPIFIAIRGRTTVSSASKYVAKCHFVETQEEGYQILLSEYGNEDNSPFVYCIDDKTIFYLDTRYDEIKDKFIFFNAGCKGRVTKYMDKLEILQLAEKHGLNVLMAYRCKRGEIPEKINYPVITKSISPVIGGWKSDVNICYSANDLMEAYKSIKAETVLVQEYIEKKNEYCLEGFSVNHGKDSLVTIASTYDYLLPNYYSPYMTVNNLKNDIVKRALKEMFAEIGFEGIYEVEFLIAENNTLYFSEINFRNSTWSYASSVAEMNLPFLWAKDMLLGYVEAEDEKVISVPFKGMVEPVDFGKRVDSGKISLVEWIKDFKEAKCTYYYNEQDPEPFKVLEKDWDRLK